MKPEKSKPASGKVDALREQREARAEQREAVALKRSRCKHPEARRFATASGGHACADCGADLP
jgi:hypothetical protein